MTDKKNNTSLHEQVRDPQHQILMLMVEMRSELGAIRELVTTQGVHTNQRIDDLSNAVNQRLTTAETDIDNLSKDFRLVSLKSASSGGLSGALAAIGIELVKLLTKGG